ncbi:MAG: 16S rRNA (guanine(966)-N(2))-methyltransferase RsmD [Eubacterium sp.]|nr:16S rRNA (guanine(966)-N(2))-methyltransferase RsmD [Eubacterium sp.]
MRVIAGSAKSLPLKTVKGDKTRPTTDRIKETLFNMLNPYLPGCRFLDLFAGSGGIGIEALSRGASFACFVEQSRDAVRCIRENLAFTRLSGRAEVAAKDVFAFLSAAEGKPYDLVFMDPPYDHLYEKRALELLSENGLIHNETLLVAEASLKTDFSYLDSLGFTVVRMKKYKTNMHLFVKMKTDAYETELE